MTSAQFTHLQKILKVVSGHFLHLWAIISKSPNGVPAKWQYGTVPTMKYQYVRWGSSMHHPTTYLTLKSGSHPLTPVSTTSVWKHLSIPQVLSRAFHRAAAPWKCQIPLVLTVERMHSVELIQNQSHLNGVDEFEPYYVRSERLIFEQSLHSCTIDWIMLVIYNTSSCYDCTLSTYAISSSKG